MISPPLQHSGRLLKLKLDDRKNGGAILCRLDIVITFDGPQASGSLNVEAGKATRVQAILERIKEMTRWSTT